MDLSAAQGTSATNTITANLVTGSAEPVSLSASGLPSGASASFSQKTCSPTCSSLLTIAAASSTPADTYTITVTGAGGGVNKTTSFTLTVTSTASTTLTSPAQGTTFSPGQTVTATGSGTNLTWWQLTLHLMWILTSAEESPIVTKWLRRTVPAHQVIPMRHGVVTHIVDDSSPLDKINCHRPVGKIITFRLCVKCKHCCYAQGKTRKGNYYQTPTFG